MVIICRRKYWRGYSLLESHIFVPNKVVNERKRQRTISISSVVYMYFFLFHMNSISNESIFIARVYIYKYK